MPPASVAVVVANGLLRSQHELRLRKVLTVMTMMTMRMTAMPGLVEEARR